MPEVSNVGVQTFSNLILCLKQLDLVHTYYIFGKDIVNVRSWKPQDRTSSAPCCHSLFSRCSGCGQAGRRGGHTSPLIHRNTKIDKNKYKYTKTKTRGGSGWVGHLPTHSVRLTWSLPQPQPAALSSALLDANTQI